MKCDDLEVYLSGFLDHELTQQMEQQVTLHLETCQRCRQLLGELRELKRGTESLPAPKPTGKEWDRMEKHILQQFSRGLGWAIVIVWAIVTTCFSVYEYATSPGEPLLDKVLVFSLFLGLALLFLSVLSQRIRDSASDRYKGVQK